MEQAIDGELMHRAIPTQGDAVLEFEAAVIQAMKIDSSRSLGVVLSRCENPAAYM